MRLLILFILIPMSMGLHAQEWLTDLSEAQALAKEKEIPIILVFQGSDWCAPCIKLEKEVWNTTVFIDFAKDHYVLLKADFPRKKANQLDKNQQQKNAALAEKYNPQGFFPLVLVLDKNAKVLGKTGYQKSRPQEYIDLLNSFVAHG